ncbi:MAG TPA: hypothetical protein VFH39_01775 [Candidatus Saccharimonadales bacterium]|nr:hypothetical protein [Candidatus Saccharimonadales bacterium]
MQADYWHRQLAGKPLFPELEWSRPENRNQAGKLLIIGGNAHGFAAPGEAYGEATKAGIGSTRVVLPQRVKSLVGSVLPDVDYAMSNPSGGFSQLALNDLLMWADWADGVLLAGDFGRNSETAILLEKFLAHHAGQVTLTKDAVDYFTPSPQALLARDDTTLALSFAQLQKLAMNGRFTTAFTSDMDLIRCVDALHEFTTLHSVNLITKHLENLIVAVDGQVSTTKLEEVKIWRLKTAAHASVWWLQTPAKPFEALTTSLVTK